jgi:hypothetical protein
MLRLGRFDSRSELMAEFGFSFARLSSFVELTMPRDGFFLRYESQPRRLLRFGFSNLFGSASHILFAKRSHFLRVTQGTPLGVQHFVRASSLQQERVTMHR